MFTVAKIAAVVSAAAGGLFYAAHAPSVADTTAFADAAQKLAAVFPEQAQESYYAACFVARCIPLARQEGQSGDRYLQQSLALLRQAAVHARPGLERLPDERQIFQPLAAHPDFATLMRELDSKGSAKAGS